MDDATETDVLGEAKARFADELRSDAVHVIEASRASCEACQALGGCSLCDGTGVVFDEEVMP